MKYLKISLGALACSLIIANVEGAPERYGTLTQLEMNLKLDEDLTVGAIFGLNTGYHHEQNPTIDNRITYDHSGESGTEYGLTAKLLLGSVGKAKVTGTGGLSMYNRVLSDTNLNDSTIITPGKLRVYYPRTGINITVPFGKFFELQMNNSFERRLMTKPSPKSEWFWSPQMRIESIPFTMVNLAVFADYRGYDNANSDILYLATSSFGIKLEPVQNLNLGLSYRFQWKPDASVSDRISQIHAALGYTFDLSK